MHKDEIDKFHTQILKKKRIIDTSRKPFKFQSKYN